MRLQANFSGRINELEHHFDVVIKKFNINIGDLDRRTAELEILVDVDNHIQFVFSKWEAGRYKDFTLLQRLFVVCSELHWGAFGDYQRYTKGDNLAGLKLEIVRNKLISHMRFDCAKSDMPRPIEFWLEDHQAYGTPENQMLIACLSNDYPDADACPLPAILADRSNPKALKSLHLPRCAGPEKLVNHMLTQTALTQESLC